MVLYSLLTPLAFALLGYSASNPSLLDRASICATIQGNISSDSRVYYPGKRGSPSVLKYSVIFIRYASIERVPVSQGYTALGRFEYPRGRMCR
jgi:hypothetical protein